MKLISALFILIVCYGSTTASAEDFYGQNVYMFPDEVINSIQPGCANNVPVKQSKFYYPNPKQPGLKARKQQYNSPSINRLSRNVAYVSDLHKYNSYEVPFSNEINYPGTAQRYINEEQFKKQTLADSAYRSNRVAQNIRKRVDSLNGFSQGARSIKSAKYLYASDLEIKNVQNPVYRQNDNNGRYFQKEKIRYVPVPVYVYKIPEPETDHLFGNISQNDLLSMYQRQLRNEHYMTNNQLKRENINFDPYADIETPDINYYNMNKREMDFNTDNPWATDSTTDLTTEHNIFSSLENPLSEQRHSLNKLLKYSDFSSNDEFYNPAQLLKYNLSGDIFSPDSSYLLQP